MCQHSGLLQTTESHPLQPWGNQSPQTFWGHTHTTITFLQSKLDTCRIQRPYQYTPSYYFPITPATHSLPWLLNLGYCNLTSEMLTFCKQLDPGICNDRLWVTSPKHTHCVHPRCNPLPLQLTIHICWTRKHHYKYPTTAYSEIDNCKIWDTDVPQSTPLFLRCAIDHFPWNSHYQFTSHIQCLSQTTHLQFWDTYASPIHSLRLT